VPDAHRWGRQHLLAELAYADGVSVDTTALSDGGIRAGMTSGVTYFWIVAGSSAPTRPCATAHV
jgi:hypothetical protein